MRRFFNNGNQGGFDNHSMQEGFDEDMFPWDDQEGFKRPPGPFFRNNSMRPRYSEAYGDYRGGYGPGGGFGPRPPMPGLGPRMPPPLMHFMPPPGFSPRAPMWGKGNGPRALSRRNAVDDKAIKYLKRCGLTKDQLRNLPHDLLRLIQPEYCGLCAFECDSFTTSRMHYMSKNHLKAQKKWMSKTKGTLAPNEEPFKSRDLYCELCDVQITSKTHGDAHYDGKLHQGIVEGRKKPKNPLLLQNKMKQRLEQLIRREKRCLKASKEPATGEEEENEEKEVEEVKEVKVVKAVSPELYCDICKTTVTCSEQMTMHMNGKRHLTKEKRHILSMMRGETPDEIKAEDKADEDYDEEYEGDEVDEDGEAQTEAETEAETEAPTEAQAAADDEDWGTEAWDNQEDTKETA